MPLLVLLLIVVPLVELYVLIQVGQAIGALPAVALLVLLSLAGAWVLRHEGVRAWTRFRRTVESGRLPTAEMVDGALIVLGGVLLLAPGFVTDVVGLLLVVPPTRALLNRLVRARARAFVGLPEPPRGWRRRSGDRAERQVIDVQVVDVQRTAPPAPPEVPPPPPGDTPE